MTAVAVGAGQRRWRRLWRVVRPFANATLLLAVLLVALSLWLTMTARSFVDDTLADIKLGLLQEADRDIEMLLADYRDGVAQFDALRERITRLAEDPSTLVDPRTRSDIEALKKDADRIATGLDRIASGQLELSQATLESLAVTLVRAYGEVRGCKVTEARSSPSQGSSTRLP